MTAAHKRNDGDQAMNMQPLSLEAGLTRSKMTPFNEPHLVPAVIGTFTYSVTVTDDKMSPRYGKGEVVHVHAEMPVPPGKHVLIIAREANPDSSPATIIGRLVNKTPSQITIEQLRPLREIVIPVARILTMHRIVGSSVAD